MKYLMILSILFVSVLGYSQAESDHIPSKNNKEVVDTPQSKAKIKKFSNKVYVKPATKKHTAKGSNAKGSKPGVRGKNKYVRNTKVKPAKVTKRETFKKYASDKPSSTEAEKRTVRKKLPVNKKAVVPVIIK